MLENTYNLKNDIIFKAFFGRKGKEEYLTEFLEALLEIKISKIDIRDEVSLEKLSKTERGGRLDLQATINDGTIINIEMQKKDYGNIQIRTIFYGSKIIARETVVATNYEDMKKTILVNILNYEVFPEYDEYISKTVIVLENHRECVVTENVEWWYIELPKFRKQKPDMDKEINQWLAFIDGENEELIQVAEKKNKTLQKASKDINYLTGDAEVRRMAELQEKWDLELAASINHARKLGTKIGMEDGIKKGLEDGIKKGLEDGMKKGLEDGMKKGLEDGMKKATRQNAKKMKELDYSPEEIAKITGLSLAEIEAL